MIKANELRIGNLLQCRMRLDGPMVTIKLTGVNDSYGGWISWTAEGCCPAPFVALSNHGYEGIPLTEEWLVKLGFEKADEEYAPGEGWYEIQAVRHNLQIALLDTHNLVAIRDEHDTTVLFRKILIAQYVHQLQNLYFALTGEELRMS